MRRLVFHGVANGDAVGEAGGYAGCVNRCPRIQADDVGGGGIGLCIGPKCMQLAIKKAKHHGIGMVCVRNSTHYGFAGYYPLMAEKAGCIGISGTNARPSIAPTYGVEPMMGTNPIVFGMPSTDDFPFVLDCATSVNQRGKIEKYA